MKTMMRIKMSVNSDKVMRKAMKVAVGANGIISVAIEGEFKNELVVVGHDGVDAACLVNTLRMKVCHATLETLEEVKPNVVPPDVDQPQPDNDTDEGSSIETTNDDNGSEEIVASHCCLCQCPCICYEQPNHEMYIYDSYGPTTGCTIM